MFGFEPAILLVYAAAFLRIGGILFTLPIFGDVPTPVRARIALSAALTALIVPTLPPDWLVVPTDAVGYLPLILKELSIGLVIGFSSRIIFEGIVMAASIVGYQMGFGAANLFIPDAGSQLNSFTALHRLLIILIFLGLNLHHIFLGGIFEAFQILPAGSANISTNVVDVMVGMTSNIFVIGIQLAAPVLIALLFTMGALGLMARTVPQLNVFALSFPISFFVGMIIYVASLPFYPSWMQDRVQENYDKTIAAIREMR